jgi:predicted ABC-type transport system involved in lysophospholipase L1 biosynthesis ATPase subunit
VRKRVTGAADVLEPHEHLDRKPANLSGGQRQRVAMGRAIVRQADALSWLDTSRVHVFDPGTGENLTRDADAGAELIRMAEENWTEQLEEGRREAASVSG